MLCKKWIFTPCEASGKIEVISLVYVKEKQMAIEIESEKRV